MKKIAKLLAVTTLVTVAAGALAGCYVGPVGHYRPVHERVIYVRR